ncbi:MAG TPA: hypothetical protein VKZ59_11820 [Acidobacteriota bacterium]|nr:hypothetical protein [Acidobacteriota bacterium]
MRHVSWLIALFFSWSSALAQDGAPSRCHVFIDYNFIWTLEMVQSPSQSNVPILNIITFEEGTWDLRPDQIHLQNPSGQEAEIKRFSMDTGIEDEPYLTPYLKVQGDSFIGLDLEGDFQNFGELQRVYIDLGDSRFELQAVDCLDFEGIAERINQVNFDSPDVREDYAVLQIQLMGRRVARPRF